jgi:hypothetical protein
MKRLAFLLLVLPLPAAAMPADVGAYVDRRAQCFHWAGEEPYDEARSSQIAGAIKKLRCSALPYDDKTLRHRYRRSPAALKALRKAAADYPL